MYRKELNDKHYKRSIVITDNNEVIINEYSSNIDCKNETLQTEVKEKYQSVARLNLGDERFVQCTDGDKIDWYNLVYCCKCLSLTDGESVHIDYVAGNAYFKVIGRDESYAAIYDELGTLLSKADKPIRLDVIFSACGACIQKTDDKGTKRIYNLEGHLVG